MAVLASRHKVFLMFRLNNDQKNRTKDWPRIRAIFVRRVNEPSVNVQSTKWHGHNH